MSDRKGWYLKPGVKCSVPGVMFTVVVTPRRADSQSIAGVFVREWGHAHAMVSYRRRGKLSTVGPVRIDHAAELREWMSDHAMIGRYNWVVCPIASEVLTLSRWWEWAERQGVRFYDQKTDGKRNLVGGPPTSEVVLTALVVRGTPDIITYVHRGISWRWVSGHNYFPDGPGSSDGRTFAGASDQAGGREADPGATGVGAETARRWHAAMTGLTDWWTRHARSPFGTTIGQLSMGVLRTYAPPKILCTNNDEDALRLERAGAYGGRASCWYLGSVGLGSGEPVRHTDESGTETVRQTDGPVTQFDVRSMYPWLMREHSYPCKLISYREDMNVKDIDQCMDGYGVVARVTIDSHSGEYPYRKGERITYPVGQFTTVLCGAELRQAITEGALRAVHSASIYKLGRPFCEFVDKMLSERLKARALDNWTHELVCKMISNALAGKLAQRGGGWERAPKEDMPGKWGESFVANYQTGCLVKHRHIAGVAWKWTADATGRGPHTAAFAYLASYGRMMMRSIRQSLPSRSVVSQDTDGLWTLPSGTRSLESRTELIGEDPGLLSKKGHGSNARWWGPRHYVVDGVWTLAGFHGFRVNDDRQTVIERVDTTLWASRTTRAPSQTVHHDRTKSLPIDIGAGVVAPDGWVTPPRADRL